MTKVKDLRRKRPRDASTFLALHGGGPLPCSNLLYAMRRNGKVLELQERHPAVMLAIP